MTMDQKNKLYQLTCLFSPAIADGKLDQLVDKIKSGITSCGGSLSNEVPLSNPIKKTLAYPIKKCQEAFYFSLNFVLPVQTVNELNKQLSSNNNIIRYLITNRAQDKSSQSQIRPREKQKESLDFKIIDKIEPLPREKTPAIISDQKEKKEKIKIEELDKKLEEILNQ